MPASYEYRVLQMRKRWTMMTPYEEWFRPTGRDYRDSDSARVELRRLRAENPDRVFKMQRRPVIQDWKDIT